MTAFDDVKQFEGKDVLVVSKHGTVYVGRVSDLKEPSSKDEKDTIALGRFRYYRFSKRDPRDILEYIIKDMNPNAEGRDLAWYGVPQFPFKKTDMFYDISIEENQIRRISKYPQQL